MDGPNLADVGDLDATFPKRPQLGMAARDFLFFPRRDNKSAHPRLDVLGRRSVFAGVFLLPTQHQNLGGRLAGVKRLIVLEDFDAPRTSHGESSLPNIEPSRGVSPRCCRAT